MTSGLRLLHDVCRTAEELAEIELVAVNRQECFPGPGCLGALVAQELRAIVEYMILR
jgi:hypothetical protein